MKSEVFLVAMPFMMVFTWALAHISPVVPNCILIHAVVRLVGSFALSQLISNRAQEHMDQSHSTMLRCQWLNFLQSSFWSKRSVGPIHIHSDCKYVCSGKNKIARRTAHGTWCARHTLDQIAAGSGETFGSC